MNATSYENPVECSVRDCTNPTTMQTNVERRFDVALCDPEDGYGHYMEFILTVDESWGEAKRWIEKNCEPRV